MSLPPLNPEKSASGIILDPKTLERVVPTSKRSDGTVRKELKIRPGFTPQEDIGRFRSNRQAAADARKGYVVGSNRAPVKQANPDNVFAQEPKAKTKAQLKNEKRREKKRLEAGNKDWDQESDDAEEGEDVQAEGGADGVAESSGTGVKGRSGDGVEMVASEEAFPPLAMSGAGHGSSGTPTLPVGLKPEGSSIPASRPADGGRGTSPTKSKVQFLSPPPSGSDGPSSASDLATPPSRSADADPLAAIASTSKVDGSSGNGSGSGSGSGTTTKEKPASKQRHPIQGGRDGPIGLAHPPPIEPPKPSKTDNASWRKEKSVPGAGAGAGSGTKQGAKTGQGKKKPAPASKVEEKPVAASPRVRKEVKVREGGMNDVGSLASRVRNLVLDNQRPARSTGSGKKEGSQAQVETS